MIDEGGEEGEEGKPQIPSGILYCILLIAQIYMKGSLALIDILLIIKK
jgi:hypothetical protein